ncbi:MAG: efflux transporter outer membrane subunit [Alphaproteobacteria bacterium]
MSVGIPSSGPRKWVGRAGRLAAACALALALAACTMGPDFEKPAAPPVKELTKVPMPAETVAADAPTGDAQRFLAGEPVPERWWLLYNSPELNRRIDAALANSPTIASAQAALKQAKENVAAAAGGRYPSIGLNGGPTAQKNSQAQFGPGESRLTPVKSYTLYNATADVSYTLDLFGGIERGIESQKALEDVQRADLAGTYLTLIANVVTASFEEASLRAQIAAQEDIIAAFERTTGLVEQQAQFGAKSQLDVLTARSQLEAQRAQLPALRLQLEQTENQLAAYLGRFPGDSGLEPVHLDQLALPRDIPVSLPSTVVQQRPDIQAAEATLHSATAQVGVAIANMLPKITLSGSIGSQALQVGELFTPGMGLWSIGMGLAQPIFQGGTLRAQRRAADAAMEKAAADYQATVVNAFRNVADSLRALVLDADSLRAQAVYERSASGYYDLVDMQYRAGAVNILNVLDADRQRQQSRIALIQARATRLKDTAALYQALGGGWQEALAAADLKTKTDTGPSTPP